MRVETVRVKRDGGRGHHIINKSAYDKNPDAYELVDEKGKSLSGSVSGEPKGLTVVELKAALEEKGIEYSATAKKAELQALLDGAG